MHTLSHSFSFIRIHANDMRSYTHTHTPKLKLQTLTIALTLLCFPLKRLYKCQHRTLVVLDANSNIAIFHMLSFLSLTLCVCSLSEFVSDSLSTTYTLCSAWVKCVFLTDACIRIPHKLHTYFKHFREFKLQAIREEISCFSHIYIHIQSFIYRIHMIYIAI